MTEARTIFRYPGGKYKATKFIRPFWEQIEHDEYREPFVGGGSVFLAKKPVEIDWINDMDKNLMAFYRIIANKKTREKLIKELLSLKISKDLYDELYWSKPRDNFNRAKRYYVLNRCSFSGIIIWNAFIGDSRYNIKNAQNLIRRVGERLYNTKTIVTSKDFEESIETKQKGKKAVFLYLDPPYAESRQIVAYKLSFRKKDHERLCKLLKRTNYSFLLTYDNCEYIRKLYNWAHQYERTWTYSVANARVHHNPREAGNELFISNFKLRENAQKKLRLF